MEESAENRPGITRRSALTVIGAAAVAAVAAELAGILPAAPAFAAIPYTYPTDPYRPGTEFLQRFGPHRRPITGPSYPDTHWGLDIPAVNDSTDIYSIARGTVIGGSWNPRPGLGNHLVIRNDDGVKVTYGHFAEPPIKQIGDQVHVGEVIGIMGGSALGRLNTYGRHLHIEVDPGRGRVDPRDFLKRRVSKIITYRPKLTV